MSKKFRRTIENFTCKNCGQHVLGDGFTNHCPRCLFSRHVDVNPGDRKALCQGLMQPIGLEIKNGRQIIVHRCLMCRTVKRNQAQPADNIEQITKLSSRS